MEFLFMSFLGWLSYSHYEVGRWIWESELWDGRFAEFRKFYRRSLVFISHSLSKNLTLGAWFPH